MTYNPHKMTLTERTTLLEDVARMLRCPATDRERKRLRKVREDVAVW